MIILNFINSGGFMNNDNLVSGNDDFEDIETDDDETEEEWDEEEGEIYTLEDEDGIENDFTFIKRIEINGHSYVAFAPFDEDEIDYVNGDDDDDEESFVILKIIEENGEKIFISIDDDDEFDNVVDIFEEQLLLEEEDDDV